MGAAGSEPTEVEIKLSVARPDAVRGILEQPEPELLAGFEPAGPARMVTLTDRYLDTDRWVGRLAIAGMRARLRDDGETVVLTVKRAGEEDRGVTTRVELEGPATRAVDPGAWAPSTARDALLEVAAGSRLREIARLRQRRLTRLFRRDTTTVEVSLDGLEALDGDHVAGRRFELEAELVEGEAADLGDLGERLREIEGVGAPLGSKLRFALEALSVR